MAPAVARVAKTLGVGVAISVSSGLCRGKQERSQILRRLFFQRNAHKYLRGLPKRESDARDRQQFETAQRDLR
jgi:hypothetical protein